MESSIKIEAFQLKKVFNSRTIFSNINFKLEDGSSLAIVGKNGSGKSTLAKIIAGVLTPNGGECKFWINGSEIRPDDRFKYIGFVSNYLKLYEEFTAFENLRFFTTIRKLKKNTEDIFTLLKKVSLFERKDDLVRTYSSGMKQRLIYAFAILHNPKLLILDEPSSNLDTDGVAIVHDIVKEQKNNGCVIIATNDKEDLEYCNEIIDLDIKN